MPPPESVADLSGRPAVVDVVLAGMQGTKDEQTGPARRPRSGRPVGDATRLWRDHDPVEEALQIKRPSPALYARPEIVLRRAVRQGATNATTIEGSAVRFGAHRPEQ